jgi:acyl carrier protein
MVPSVFVAMEALPRTASGKIDRQRLPEPGRARQTEEGYMAPRTPVEQAIASIWGDLLRVERVGASDNFFDLGGHSLLATQVISRLREAFGLELPLRILFETPTVEELALAIAQARAEQAAPDELARLLEEIEKESPVPPAPSRPS